ncbi:MAG: hypothetical protein P8X90_07595 [Desulfobacterales bacterium]|jgi:hypothetical protein
MVKRFWKKPLGVAAAFALMLGFMASAESDDAEVGKAIGLEFYVIPVLKIEQIQIFVRWPQPPTDQSGAF